MLVLVELLNKNMEGQFNAIFNTHNSKFILKVLKDLMIDQDVRVLEDEFSTIVYNSKIEGQKELINRLERKIIEEDNKIGY
jgi:hypothetical protein